MMKQPAASDTLIVWACWISQLMRKAFIAFSFIR